MSSGNEGTSNPKQILMVKANPSEIKNFLESLGLEVHEQPSTDPASPTQLTFIICEDPKERPIYISLIVHPVKMADMQELLEIKTPIAYHRVQLFSPLPFQFKSEAAGELARFLMMINKSVEYPGFECNETDRILYFKMAWPLEGEAVDECLLATQIYYISSLMMTFCEPIEKVGNNELSIKEYIEGLIKGS